MPVEPLGNCRESDPHKRLCAMHWPATGDGRKEVIRTRWTAPGEAGRAHADGLQRAGEWPAVPTGRYAP